MKFISVFVLCLVSLFAAVSAQCQAERSEFPECSIVNDWSPPGEVRVFSENGGMLISWIPSPERPTSVEGYEIARSGELNGESNPIARVQGTVNQYIDQSAAPNTFYWYRIRGFREGLCSPYSEPVRGTRE